jgi:hypothetical protein
VPPQGGACRDPGHGQHIKQKVEGDQADFEAELAQPIVP